MKASKDRKPDKDITDLGLDEALARLLQTDRQEVIDAKAKIEQEDEKVREYVKEREESIRKGARRTRKRFRL